MDLKYKASIPHEIWRWGFDHAKGNSQFANFLEERDGEIVMRVFALQKRKNEALQITEVMRRATGCKEYVLKNLMVSGYFGYSPVYKKENKYGTYGMLRFDADDFDEWLEYDDKAPGITSYYTNLDMLCHTNEFCYCGYRGGYDVIEYLNAYRKDQSVEIFGKLGIPLSPRLMKRAKSDGQFRRFLYEHCNEIALYGVEATETAYSRGISIEDARRITYEHRRNCIRVAYAVPSVKGTDIDRDKLASYLEFLGWKDQALYDDYLQAVIGLGLDLKDTKNVFPDDLRRMHDLRCSEYEAQRINLEKKSRKKLIVKFRAASEKLKIYEQHGDEYSVLIPDVPSELKKEGSALHHCVGSMGYDVKMANGKSFIAFVRKTNNIDKPYVTVEVDCKTMKVRQRYGNHDSRPEKKVCDFIDEWEKRIGQLFKEQKCKKVG